MDARGTSTRPADSRACDHCNVLFQALVRSCNGTAAGRLARGDELSASMRRSTARWRLAPLSCGCANRNPTGRSPYGRLRPRVQCRRHAYVHCRRPPAPARAALRLRASSASQGGSASRPACRRQQQQLRGNVTRLSASTDWSPVRRQRQRGDSCSSDRLDPTERQRNGSNTLRRTGQPGGAG
jgi:hypothetical protein